MRKLGHTEIRISPVIMGTWQAGKTMWIGVDDDESRKAIWAAYEAGITTFDTAFAYGDGHSERLLGEVLKSVRDKVVIATKVFSDKLSYELVLSSCHSSLKNLNTDYIDLFQIHWPSGSFNSPIVPIKETMRALVQLKEEGKIRAIGVSNFSLAQLKEAEQYGRIDALQPPYSLFWRNVENELQPYCADNDISILAYSPLAQGLLTGKFKSGHHFDPKDNRAYNKLFQPEHFERALAAVEQLKPIAKEYNTSTGNLAIAWLIAQSQTSAIVGARNMQQAKNNAEACEINISNQDLQKISKIGNTVADMVIEDPLTHDFAAAIKIKE